jgi:hypothetical protein
MVLIVLATDTPVWPVTLTVTAKPPVVLLKIKYSFLLFGTSTTRAAVRAPVNSMYMLRATPVAPFGMVKIVGEAESVTACVTYPAMDCSSRVPRLVLVVTPQVPDCSPVPISSRPRLELKVVMFGLYE